MKTLTAAFALLLLLGCGGEEAATPEPEPEPVVAPEPPPEPEPAPEPLAECPEDTWAVGARDDYQPASNGAEAAQLARRVARGNSWTRLSVCKSIDGVEHHLICSPDGSGRGADCNLGLPGQVCTATIPTPMVAISVGELVDTTATPTNTPWSCSDAD